MRDDNNKTGKREKQNYKRKDSERDQKGVDKREKQLEDESKRKKVKRARQREREREGKVEGERKMGSKE